MAFSLSKSLAINRFYKVKTRFMERFLFIYLTACLFCSTLDLPPWGERMYFHLCVGLWQGLDGSLALAVVLQKCVESFIVPVTSPCQSGECDTGYGRSVEACF